jgi:hypothetical protein
LDVGEGVLREGEVVKRRLGEGKREVKDLTFADPPPICFQVPIITNPKIMSEIRIPAKAAIINRVLL